MEPIIYALPKTEQLIEPSELNIYFDNHPNPKLIKYGFNNIGNQLDLIALTSIPSYKAGLEFDFEQDGKDSLSGQANALFKTKKFDQTFGEFWEIFTLFGLLDTNQTIYSPKNSDTIKGVVDAYQKITNSKQNINISNNSKSNAGLVVYKYSDIDIDENAATQFILDALPNLLSVQDLGSNMILQLFNLQTQITAEIIYLLNTLYVEAYVIKPSIVSDLFNTKYLVLINLKNKFKLVIPSHPNNVYLSSLGLKNLPNNFETVIQCVNSDVMPKKYKRYNLIKSYLDTKVYEGATYQEMIQAQIINAKKWLSTFDNISNLKTILDSALEKTNSRCNTHAQLINMFN